MKICPSCLKNNCGNWAACARRVKAARDAEISQAAADCYFIAAWFALWQTIAMLQKPPVPPPLLQALIGPQLFELYLDRNVRAIKAQAIEKLLQHE